MLKIGLFICTFSIVFSRVEKFILCEIILNYFVLKINRLNLKVNSVCNYYFSSSSYVISGTTTCYSPKSYCCTSFSLRPTSASTACCYSYGSSYTTASTIATNVSTLEKASTAYWSTEQITYD